MLSKRASYTPKESSAMTYCYKSFEEFKCRIGKLKLSDNWKIKFYEDSVHVLKLDDFHEVPQFDVFVYSSLKFVIRVFGWRVPDSSTIHFSENNTMYDITLSNLIKLLSSTSICPGLNDADVISKAVKHFVPQIVGPQNCEQIKLGHPKMKNI